MFVSRNLARTVIVAAVVLSARPGFGAPALTTIQDILYKADGTRFNGTIYIGWTNFQSGENSTIPVQAITIPIVNGAFKVQLAPTTNASPGANYSVRYSSQGKFQFTETWAVPPSSVPLRVRDVRISAGSTVGPPPVLTQITIADVTGLPNELALRPSKGVSFQPARAAIINSSGQLDGATGSLTDCVRVDGSSGPCGTGGGSSPIFVDNETPGGIVDGNNTQFTVQSAPSPASSLMIFRNGLMMRQGIDYSLSTGTISFVAASAPQPGDVISASYRIQAAGAVGLYSFSAPQVLCSGAGASTMADVQTQLASCTIPAGTLAIGDRVEVVFDAAHQGSSAGFTMHLWWGGSMILTQSVQPTESLLSARSSLVIYSGGAQWRTESWASASGSAVGIGLAPDSIASPLQIRILGQFASSTTDSLALRNYTVIRYPAQANP